MVITKLNVKHLQAVISRHIAADGLLMNQWYNLPDRAWFFNEFAMTVLENFDRLGIDYRLESFDCDAFALNVVAWARVSHMLAGAGTEDRASIAVGLMVYEMDRGGHHVVVFAVVMARRIEIQFTADDWLNNYDVVFMQTTGPNTGEELKLSEKEKFSATAYVI